MRRLHLVGHVLAGAVAILYVWFGALKLLDASPVEGLVRTTLPLGAPWAVVALGAFEVLLGLALVWGRWARAVLALVLLHVAGTFAVFVVAPEAAFQDGRPGMLSMVGEFIVKNIVIVAAVWAATVLRREAPRASRGS